LKKNRLGLFLVLVVVLFMGVVAAGQKTNPAPAAKEEFGPLVEVHGPDIACVPLTAKYVTYNGVVRKIAKLVPMAAGPVPDRCDCPYCCEGRCYVLVYGGDLVGGKAAPLSLYYLWINC